MTFIRVQPDDGPPETLLSGGSRVTDDEQVVTLLELAAARLREQNRGDAAARARSTAITHIETAALWLRGLERGEVR